MATLDVVTVNLSGFPGGPGTNTFYFDGTATYNLTALHDLYGLILAYIPSNVTITMPTTGVTINDIDGSLVGGWTKAATSTMTGSNTGNYAGGVGATMRWETGVVQDGHRVRGRTYLVPLANLTFDADGTLTGAAKTLLQNTANSTVAAYGTAMKVWHRPRATGIPHIGSAWTILSAVVPDKSAILRSRRD